MLMHIKILLGVREGTRILSVAIGTSWMVVCSFETEILVKHFHSNGYGGKVRQCKCALKKLQFDILTFDAMIH